MPVLTKHTITRYLSTECRKQLRLMMSPPSGSTAAEHTALGMPPEQPPRPGLVRITQAGDDWAAEKLAELEQVVGSGTLIGTTKPTPRGGVAFAASPLLARMQAGVTPGTFLAEHQFEVGPTFTSAYDLNTLTAAPVNLDIRTLIPDLIEVLPPHAQQYTVETDGRVTAANLADVRIPLRIIDIKLSSQPGAGYFAEVVYYSIALAGWLVDHHLDHAYVVAANPAIWPGSHDASELVKAQREAAKNNTTVTAPVALAALNADLIEAPFEVFAARLRHFFTVELPDVLHTPWKSLPFHVTSKCVGCDYLGQDWGSAAKAPDPQHCLPLAESTDHLSRVPFLGRGASQLLTGSGHAKVADLATLPSTDPAFDQHHSLRSQRTVIAGRANSLISASPGQVPAQSGTSAVLPKFAHLRVYITADFDASSAITLAFGLKAWWREPLPYGSTQTVRTNKWEPGAFLVDARDLLAEERELLNFLEYIDKMLAAVGDDDTKHPANSESTVQFYVWDSLTYKHLTRVIGRHLPALMAHPHGMRYLAWLFPPEQVLQNDRLVGSPAITVVGDVVRTLVALPVAHHYSLLNTARNYHRPTLQPPFSDFWVPNLFEDPLSDQIPSERAHDIWARVGGNYNHAAQASDLQRTIKARLRALEEVTARLSLELGSTLRKAPTRSSITTPRLEGKLTPDQMLILAFARLNSAVDAHDLNRVRAMPTHEREARFKSALLPSRLDGQARMDALSALGLPDGPTREVYTIAADSTEAAFSNDDFLCAIVPQDQVEILDWGLSYFQRKYPSQANYPTPRYASMADVLQVNVVAFDRDQRLLVVDASTYQDANQTRDQIEAAGLLDLSRDVSLEKVHKDFLLPKLKTTLMAIGKTPKAVASPVAVQALGAQKTVRATPRVPVEDVLWDPKTMEATPVVRNTLTTKSALIGAGLDLNASQWAAWEHAMTHRLSLLWGPPGTGKSKTLKNVALGAAMDAAANGKGLRVLVTAFTNAAINNLLRPITNDLNAFAPSANTWRLRSRAAQSVTWAIDLETDKTPTQAMQPLLARLDPNTTEITFVGASAQQVHKLALASSSPVSELFDLIILDEASQMDMANAVLPLATIADHGVLVVAGDPLQLPPIHQVAPPKGTEALVGSVYAFLKDQHGVSENTLDRNYRSNSEIVELAKAAKYPPGLHAHHTGLRLNLTSPMPSGPTPPPGWPSNLVWSEDLASLLDPAKPVTCLVHPDALSGQSSEFEAQTVAALAWLLNGRMANQPSGLIGPAGPVPPSSNAYTLDELLERGLGVVTPHKAQQSRIVRLLTTTLPGSTPAQLRAAVDTVERFQGQERDVILASYAVGDPDTIADEAEFLQSLNRFNVMASRARAKLVVLLSESLVQHLPHDIEVLQASALIKAFAETVCVNRQDVMLRYLESGVTKEVSGSMRWSN